MRSVLSLGLRELLNGRVESERLELKATGSEACVDAALRTICAFANDVHQRNGGYVVFGVEEAEGQPVLPAQGLEPSTVDGLQKRLVGAISRIEPVYTASFSIETLDGATLLVLRCPPGATRPYVAPPRKSSGDRVPFVRIGSETKEAKGALALQLVEVSQRSSFDELPAAQGGPGDLEVALLRRLLERTGSELAEAPLSQQLRHLDLLVGDNGGARLRNAALLLFCARPAAFFPGARVEITHFPEGRGADRLDEQRLDGPIDALVEQALQRLMNLNPRSTRKPEGGLVSVQRVGWPEPALREVLVNALMHRGYEPGQADPVRIDVEPDRIVVISYPGPMPGISLDDLRGEAVRHPPQRNRRVAAFFKEMGLAETRRSGLSKIRCAMERNGNPPPVFYFDPERTLFQVDLPIHPDFRPAPVPRGRPLRLGEPCPPEALLDRGPLIERIVRALAHQSVALVGPIGRGRSSLLEGVVSQLPSSWAVLRLNGSTTTVEGLLQALVARVEEEPARFGDRQALIAGWDREKADPVDFVTGLLADVPAPTLIVLDDLEMSEHDSWHERLAALVLLARAAGLRLLTAGPDGDWLHDKGIAPTLRIELVPPLGAAAGEVLAAELLQGQELPIAWAGAVSRLAEGSPVLSALLVRELFIAGDGDVEAAFDQVLAASAHPVVARLHDAGLSPAWGRQRPRLDPLRSLVVQTAEGLPRAQILAALAPQLGRAAVVASLQRALAEGFLVEVDGKVRCEHAQVRRAWLALQPPVEPCEDDGSF